MFVKKSRKFQIILLLLMTLIACGDNAKETAKVKPPTAAPEKTAPAAVVAQPEQNPVPQKTRDVYQWYCTQCHGLKGKGDGINAKHLTVPPRDHTKGEYLETRTDKQLFDAIKLGGLAVGRAPCMPSWGNTLKDETIHSLVRYIRELCECEAL